MKSIQYLNEIRESEGLARAVLRKISVEGDRATFFLVTDANYTEGDIRHAEEVTARYATGLRSAVRVMKSVPGETDIRLAAAEFLRSEYPAVAALVPPEDIAVSLNERGGHVVLRVGSAERETVRDCVLDGLSASLARSYCGTWTVGTELCEKARGEIEHAVREEEYLIAPRFFDVVNYTPIDGGAPKQAVYIADFNREMQGVTVCGTVTHIEERVTKNGKPFFSITLSDGTGSLRVSYFTRKATLEAVRSIAAGAKICLTGDTEFYNGALSFLPRTLKIDLGEPPAGFAPEARPARPIPAQYRTVFPSPEADLVQGDLFGKRPMPAFFAETPFVVFDLETTGLSKGGVMDRIIEIGAVKIEGGSITEKFSTFVACPTRIPPEIVEITHITDDMLVGAPELEEVLPDFYKFTANCGLVCHNAQFDCRILRYYGDAEGYYFDGKQYDTMLLAQELLRLKNYKLNTVADHFGFTFNHHRAYEDAFVTAKIFMELIRLKGSLPE